MSARVKTVQESFQIAGTIVLPIVALIISQAAGLLVLSPAPVAAQPRDPSHHSSRRPPHNGCTVP